jgi:hypothetical protein
MALDSHNNLRHKITAWRARGTAPTFWFSKNIEKVEPGIGAKFASRYISSLSHSCKDAGYWKPKRSSSIITSIQGLIYVLSFSFSIGSICFYLFARGEPYENYQLRGNILGKKYEQTAVSKQVIRIVAIIMYHNVVCQ